MLRKFMSLGTVLLAAGFLVVGCSDDDSTSCGDGVMEGSEVCDGTDVGTATCQSEGFGGGVLGCSDACDALDTSMCTMDDCGDGQITGTEECDGANLNNLTCEDRGFDGGTLACDSNTCNYDESGCTTTCGDNTLQTEEVCDGALLDGADCTTESFDGGVLACNATCDGYDTGGCCTDGCTAADDTECNGDVLSTCTMGTNGCLAWVDTNCATTGGTCDDSGDPAVCTTGCTSDCPAIDDTQCFDSTTLETCTDSGNGCINWVSSTCTGGCGGTPAACLTNGSGLACNDVYDLDGMTFPHALPGIWDTGAYVFQGSCQDGAHPIYLSYTVQGTGFDNLVFEGVETATLAWPQVSAWTTTEATGFCDPAQMTEIGCADDGANTVTLVLSGATLSPGDVIYFLLSGDGMSWELNDPAVSVVEQTCGNGLVEPGEECDDGGTGAGDGCDAACVVEATYWCTGEPSNCMVPTCGDGYVNDAAEECDDGGTGTGDGCDGACAIEAGYWCAGTAPSVCEAQYDVDDTATYTWVDITTSGATVLLGDDNSDGPFPTGFSFPFYGQTFTEFYTGSNGILTFGAGSGDAWNECGLNTTSTPYNMIALMWDDLDPGDSSDLVYYEYQATCGYGGSQACLVVTYQNYSLYPGGSNDAGTFQAILFADGSILIQFQDAGTETGLGSTTGIKGPQGSMGASDHVCNTATSLAANDAICFSPDGVTGCQ